MKKIVSFLKNPILLIPIALFFASKIFYYFIALKANCHAPFSPACWLRWDSGLYLRIAEQGHTLYHCTDAETTEQIMKTKWCGTAGWSPLYPFIIQFLRWCSGLNVADIALFLTNIFFLGFLTVNAALLKLKDFKSRNWMALSIVAFCPGNVYFHAIYPVAQAAFFIALLFYFLQQNKLWFAGFFAALAVMSYPVGYFLIGVLGIYGLYHWLSMGKMPFRYFYSVFLPAISGLLVVFLYDHIQTGHWNAMFMIQSKYGNSLQSPLKMLGIHLQTLNSKPFGMHTWVEIQNVFLVTLVLTTTAFLIVTLKKKSLAFWELLYVFILWFGPFSVSAELGLYRTAAFTGTSWRNCATWPKWTLVLLLLIFLVLSYYLGILYMTDKLI